MKFLKLILGKGVRENVGNVRQTGFMVVFMLEHDPIRFLLQYDTMTNKQHEIVFLDTNNNFKHLIFLCLSRHTVKKRITCLPIFLKYVSYLFIDLKNEKNR